MDEVVALSSMLRARHVRTHPSSTRLDDIPSLTRSLPQVASDSARLLSARVAATSPSTPSVSVHPAALRLFASVGFDADGLRRAVASVPTASSFVDVPVRTPGSHRHLAAIPLRALDDSRLRANSALANAAQTELVDDLKNANERLLVRLAPLVSSSSKKGTPPKHDISTSEPDRMEGDTALAVALAVNEKYVDVIRQVALDGQAHSVPFLMHEAATSLRDLPHFVASLSVLASVAKSATPEGKPSQHSAVWGARVVLEDQFAERIPGLPARPRNASVTTIIRAVTDYVQNLQRDGKLVGKSREAVSNGQDVVPLWPKVFYCMRVGNIVAARSLLTGSMTERYPEAQLLRPYFVQFLNGREKVRDAYWRERRSEQDDMCDEIEDEGVPMSPGCLLSESAHASLEKLYANLVWSSDDPYFRACVVLLMRLDILPSYDDVMQATDDRGSFYPPVPKDHLFSLAFPDQDMASLFGSVEDYMWMRLWLCRTPLESRSTTSLPNSCTVTLSETQTNILSCGSSHFNPTGSQPLLYSFVLVCCGLYDEAVSYLITNPQEQLMHWGIHLGVVIYHLRWMKDEQAFHSALMRYVSLFSRLFPTEAAIYLMTIRDRVTLREYLRELIVSTEEYDLILTKEGEEECSGRIGKLLSSANALPSGFSVQDLEDVRIATAQYGASVAASRGEYATAAALFKQSGKLAESAQMAMRNLSEVVDKQFSTKRSFAIAEARSVRRVSEGSRIIAASIDALLKMSEFFEEYWATRYQTAWNALRGTDVIPLTSSEISKCRQDKAGFIQRFDSCLQRSTIELLKLALNIAEIALNQGHVKDDDAPERPGGTNAHALEGDAPLPNRSEIKALCVCAGYLQPSDPAFNEQLGRVEMLLN